MTNLRIRKLRQGVGRPVWTNQFLVPQHLPAGMRGMGLTICPPGYFQSGTACLPGSVTPIVEPLQPPLSFPVPVLSTTVSTGTPTGTYTQSCQQISMQGDTLHALCQRVDGSWNWSTLPNASQYVPGSIYNDNGQLGGQFVGNLIPTPPVPVPGVGTVGVGVDPVTGQVYTSMPPSGPQPPGAGFQQIEQPGPFPYVYIGGGNPPVQGLPWNPSATYNPGDTVTYQGVTWTALTSVPAGVYPGLAGYWQQTLGFGSGQTFVSQATFPQQSSFALQQQSSSGTSFSSWFKQNEGLLIGGGVGLVGLAVVMRMIRR